MSGVAQAPGTRAGKRAFVGPPVGMALAAGLPFLVYLRTMAPTVYGLDSAELTTGAYTLGIVHAPGSPLYLLVAHLFTWLPFGDVGYRVNLFSVCAASGAVLLVYLLVARLTGDVWAALGASWVLAFSYYFWVSALVAELYAPQACVMAALLWLGVEWLDTPRPSTLYALALLFGVGLGIHLSLIMLAPGFLWLLWDRGRIIRDPRVLGIALLFGLLGSAIYLYLPIRSSAGVAYNYPRAMGEDLATLKGFWWMMSCRMFAERLFSVPLARLPVELERYAYRLWSNFLGLGSLLGIVGVVRGCRRWPRLHGPLLLMFLTHLGFILSYDVIDKETMLLPTYVIWTLWIAEGARGVSLYVGRRSRELVEVSTRALLWGMAGAAILFNFRYVDLSGDWTARERGEGIFRTVEPGAFYLGGWMDAPILEYLQYVEGWRPDVEIVNLFFTRGDWRNLVIETAFMNGRPVYTSVPAALKNVGAPFEYLSECKCYRGSAPPVGLERQRNSPPLLPTLFD